MHKAEPTPQHQWLHKLIGTWTIEGVMEMGPDKPPIKSKGTETVRSLGGLWIIGEGEGEMPGSETGNMIITLGYDPVAKRFVGSWIGTMMTNMWVYNGSLDESGRVLTLDTEGPSMTDPEKQSRYQDIIEIIDDNTRTLSTQALGDDGKWVRFMTATYRRK